MSTVSAAWALARKDLRSFVRDRAAVVLSLAVPIMLVTVFGWIMAYAFGGSGGMPKVTLHVADLDQSTASQRLVDKLATLDMLRVRRVDEKALQERPVEPSLEKLIRDGDAHHVLIIPDTYDDDLASEKTPEFHMLRDPGRELEDRMVQLSLVQATMSEFGGTVWIEAVDRLLSEQGMDSEGLGAIRGWMTNIGQTISDFADETSDSQADSPGPTSGSSPTSENGARDAQTQDDVPAGLASANPNEASAENGDAGADAEFDPQAMFDFMNQAIPVTKTDVSPPDRGKQVTYQQAQSVAGMTVMMLLFALTSCGSVLLTEREEGTLQRLFAQPIPRTSVLLGKFLFVFIVGAVQIAILFAYGEWMFGVGLFRDPITLTVLSLTWVATGGAFGMFLASVSRSTKQAEGLASLLILLMAALGGCWFPLQMMNLPPLLDTVCKSTMTYWAMTGFQGMLWNQLSWVDTKTLLALGWQWGWAAALTGASVYFYRRNFCRG